MTLEEYGLRSVPCAKTGTGFFFALQQHPNPSAAQPCLFTKVGVRCHRVKAEEHPGLVLFVENRTLSRVKDRGLGRAMMVRSPGETL